MSTLLSPLAEAWRKLSGRERMLVSILATLALAAASWYLVAQPGFAAARSAENRLRSATIELATIRQSAANLAAQRDIAGSVDLPAALALARSLADSHGLTATSLEEVDGGIEGRLSTASSASAVAWAEAVSRQAAIRLTQLSIAPGDGGSLSLFVRFARTSE